MTASRASVRSRSAPAALFICRSHRGPQTHENFRTTGDVGTPAASEAARRENLAIKRPDRYHGDMRKISSIDAKNRFGQLLAAAQRAPVTVTRKGRPAAVVMSVEDYERMREAAWERLCETMETARKEALGRGLTDELLDELLADES
jgi:prevent-host-death family protein